MRGCANSNNSFANCLSEPFSNPLRGIYYILKLLLKYVITKRSEIVCVVSISHSLYIFFCRTSLPLRGVIINSRPITCVLSYLKPFLPVS